MAGKQERAGWAYHVRPGVPGPGPGGSSDADIVWRRMPTDLYPAEPGFYDNRMIHLQSLYCYPPCWGQTDNAAPICAPAKVFPPDLSMWMEDWYTLTGLFILDFLLNALEFVAGVAGNAKIFLLCLSAGCFRYDVVYD